MGIYHIKLTGQPILFNDEIGYWSNSYFLTGGDWTSVTGKINYYSYGYSLLLVLLQIPGRWFGWYWKQMYWAGIVLNSLMMVGGFFLSMKIAERMLPRMNRYVRYVACAVIFFYPATIVYEHITWTECTLVFFFWLLLYLMIRTVDYPSVWNHVALAMVAFYMYTVHQRSLGIVMSVIFLVLYRSILRKNTLPQVGAFFGVMYIYYLIHTAVKKNLQKVNYLGGAKKNLRDVLGYALTKRAFLILMMGIALMFVLWLIQKGLGRWVFFCTVVIAVFVVAYVAKNGLTILQSVEKNRLAVNEFAGQIGKLLKLFTRNGMIRIGISIAGKWFYLAGATGFVVCWAIIGLFKNAFVMIWDGCKRLWITVTGHTVRLRDFEDFDRNCWLLGVFLCWFSTFMICAIYKEGFYKNDDLFNGRYNEFVLGFLILYGLYLLLEDKHWWLHLPIILVLYVSAGWLCQYAMDEIQRTEFELAHSVVLGRLIWNYVVPNGRIRIVLKWMIPLGTSFILLVKVGRERIPRVAVVRTLIALLIPLYAWSYLGTTIVDAYVTVRNRKQAEPFPEMSSKIELMGADKPIYFLTDYNDGRSAGLLQFMLPESSVTVTNMASVDLTQDAFYVMRREMADLPQVHENCQQMVRRSGYVLFVSKHGGLYERWNWLYGDMQKEDEIKIPYISH